MNETTKGSGLQKNNNESTILCKNARRLKVFQMLISGSNETAIAKELRIGKGTVRDIVRYLIDVDAIVKIRGTKCPKIYQKGPGWSAFEESVREPVRQPAVEDGKEKFTKEDRSRGFLAKLIGKS